MRFRFRRAYTLIEVLVVAVIFAVLSAVILANFRGAARTQRLSDTAGEMVAVIKRAQALAYENAKQEICSGDGLVCRSGSSCDSGYPAGCVSQYISRYGVKFDIDGSLNKYAIGADSGGYNVFATGEIVPGGKVELPKDIVIGSVNPVPPAGEYDLIYVYDASNASPFLACSSDCVTRVTLTDTVTLATKEIQIRKQTGLIEIH